MNLPNVFLREKERKNDWKNSDCRSSLPEKSQQQAKIKQPGKKLRLHLHTDKQTGSSIEALCSFIISELLGKFPPLFRHIHGGNLHREEGC